MRTRLFGRFGAHVFGRLGLLLIVLVATLARYESRAQHSYSQRARAWLARRAIDGIGAIGWLVDGFPAHGSRTIRKLQRAGDPVDARTA